MPALEAMDPELLKERDQFKKRALFTPVVENKRKREQTDAPSGSKDEPSTKRKSKAAPAPAMDKHSYKTMGGSSSNKFSVLAKIVTYLRLRHKDGETYPLSIDEILDETNQLDVSGRIKTWLVNEALRENVKVEVSDDGKYSFKPTFKLKDRKSLLRLLKQHDLKGLGGLFLEDVMESLPNAEKILKSLQNEIIYVVRPIDKKKVLFYNDKTSNFEVDDEFKKLWRSVAVDSIEDKKIEDYLDKQGIRSMQDHGMKKIQPPVKRKRAMQKRKNPRPLKDNEHLADVLESYDDA